jgi:hypothetical protein
VRAQLAQERVVYFYELHEGDDDLFSDLLLARETEMDPDVFFDIVQTIRRRVQESFEQDTLIEAIAEELERDFEFIAITDERLQAAVNVSRVETGNFLADLEALDDDEDEDDEDRLGGLGTRSTVDDDDETLDDGDFRTLEVDLDRNPNLRPN